MKLVTWNMQGASHSTENKWNDGVQNMFTKLGLDMCCLQECGAMPGSAKLVANNYNGVAGLQYYTWGTSRTNKHILFYLSDPNGNRCNLAVVSKTAPLGGGIVYPAQQPIWRPALGFKVDNTSFVFSFHAISPNGPDAANMLTAINNTVGNNWLAAGDYNREPNTLVTAYHICPPDKNTYSVKDPKKKLDYCVKNFGNAVTGSVVNLIMSDHFPVGFNV